MTKRLPSQQQFSTAADIYRNEGVVPLAKATIDSARRGFNPRRYQGRRVDNEQRWEMIEPHIPDDAANALDIGCSEGFFSKKLADKGIFTIGIDAKDKKIRRAREDAGDLNNAMFHQMLVDPELVRTLPQFDIGLLLTVYGWWIHGYGLDTAEQMLQTLSNRCGVLFFEGHGEYLGVEDSKVRKMTSDDYIEYFTQVVPNMETIYLGEADYKGKSRTDPLFVLS